MTQHTTRIYQLQCCNCGRRGWISISQNGHLNWHFTAVGFAGLAVNRHNPPNSALRCNGCSSSLVHVYRDDPMANS